jgi:hypothetical protein
MSFTAGLATSICRRRNPFLIRASVSLFVKWQRRVSVPPGLGSHQPDLGVLEPDRRKRTWDCFGGLSGLPDFKVHSGWPPLFSLFLKLLSAPEL